MAPRKSAILVVMAIIVIACACGCVELGEKAPTSAPEATPAIGTPFTSEQCGFCHAGAYATLSASVGEHNKLNCSYCHYKHPYLPPCQECHGDYHGSELTDCSMCHVDAHAIEAINLEAITSEACGKCHADVQSALTTNPSKHTNVECSACHPEHELAATLGCEICHASIPGHYPGMTTRECEKCHSTGHTPSPVTYAADVPSEYCSSCHVDPATAMSQSGTKHASLACAYCHPQHAMIPTCESCHGTPHGTTFTDCASCHESAHNTRV
ncbi:MAG: hypothetical protein IB616_05985 [Methanosarcinales archaeon]|nr:MAG: hypothetical protein IB616_05985 [Methanosarcinales archaeon]